MADVPRLDALSKCMASLMLFTDHDLFEHMLIHFSWLHEFVEDKSDYRKSIRVLEKDQVESLDILGDFVTLTEGYDFLWQVQKLINGRLNAEKEISTGQIIDFINRNPEETAISCLSAHIEDVPANNISLRVKYSLVDFTRVVSNESSLDVTTCMDILRNTEAKTVAAVAKWYREYASLMEEKAELMEMKSILVRISKDLMRTGEGLMRENTELTAQNKHLTVENHILQEELATQGQTLIRMSHQIQVMKPVFDCRNNREYLEELGSRSNTGEGYEKGWKSFWEDAVNDATRNRSGLVWEMIEELPRSHESGTWLLVKATGMGLYEKMSAITHGRKPPASFDLESGRWDDLELQIIAVAEKISKEQPSHS